MMYKNRMKAVVFPLLLALAVVLGMAISSMMDRKTGLARIMTGNAAQFQGSKLDLIMNMINYSYVDTVDIRKIEEEAVPHLLAGLDPHSVYIPAKDMQRVNEGMVGNFGGIGVQFYKYRDTITVVKVVPGGPSEAAGIEDGDRIVKVNDSLVTGKAMTTEKVMKMMRGETGSEVSLTIVRRGVRGPLVKRVTRGSIPIKSVSIGYMVNDTTGLVLVNTFGMNTYNEFVAAVDRLKGQGMRKLIVDLRSNEGGILPIAISMINEFLEEGKLILYTQGKASPRMDYRSNGRGRYKDLELVVLLNEFSASASEIFAGAIQDNDRGVLVGRRSFGKGLVQEQRPLPDGSALRLTVARYYIPSGRCIQKPYDKGKEKYYNDLNERLMHGEFGQKDSIHFDEKLKFTTVGNRTVYGGGGVMPDVFVPADTTGWSPYLMEVNTRTQILYEYTFDFMDRHRQEMKGIKDCDGLLRYLGRFDLVEEMADYAASRGVKRNAADIRTSHDVIDNTLKAFIGRHVMDDEGFYPILFKEDKTVLKALDCGYDLKEHIRPVQAGSQP